MAADSTGQLPGDGRRLDGRGAALRHDRLRRPLRTLPDGRLVARIRDGDERAFEVVFDRYHGRLLAFCRHMLGSREEAEDALQHVFVAAHRNLVAGDERVVELRPWLYAIARNRCLSVLRARRDAVALDDVAEPAGAGLAVGEEVERRQDLREMLGDLARLPDDQRAALVLSELGDLCHDEVAAVLGVRRDKVKALVFQARESLAGWRQARETDCREIREQLATLHGGSLRRGVLRKHLEVCEGCRGFRDEVRRQREAMAVLLPVVPTVALKAKVLGAVVAGSPLAPAAGVGAGAGAAVTAGAGAAAPAGAGGGLAALGGGIAGKALAVAAVAATAGGGYAVVRDAGGPEVGAPPPRALPAAARPAPSATARPTPGRATPAIRSADSAQTAKRATRPAKAKGGRAARAGAGTTTGRPQVPGAQGLARAPKAQGLQRRRSDPPAYGRGGRRPAAATDAGAAAKGGSRGSAATRPARRAAPVRPLRPAKPGSHAPPAARPAAPEARGSGPVDAVQEVTAATG